MSTDLFAATRRPGTALFFSRDEPGDPRLGEIVRWQPQDYAATPLVLLGCPQDEGVRRNGGRVGASAAPDAVRTWLYRLVASAGMALFDLGDTRIQPSLEATHSLQRDIVAQIIADGKTLICLGGGNDLSYPDLAGLAAAIPDPLAFNVDAHLDVRLSEQRHSGTPYRMLLEEGVLHPRSFFEMGYQPFAVASSHLDYLREKGATAHSLSYLRSVGLVGAFEQALAAHNNRAIFWGIDMDVVQISEAPGVSAPNPLGMSGAELCQVAMLAGRHPHSRIFEITEINPAFDMDNRTCRLAAVVLWHFLSSRVNE